MNKKTIKILGISAAVVIVIVIGYLIYMYGIMSPASM